MKHYLMVFDRRSGSIVRFLEFSQAGEALTARFEAELEYSDNRDIEVVVLGASSDAALRRTHGRYFQGAREMAGSALGRLRVTEDRVSLGLC
ncbi:hypothetical protein [Micromonospora aurantiaca (nom. illeg.)]|uniref:hypothetical protein n=1 Tax=Micromonospora aurantiaca (nom. illeg.) TaxID=47850 RepID=UPI0037A822C3